MIYFTRRDTFNLFEDDPIPLMLRDQGYACWQSLKVAITIMHTTTTPSSTSSSATTTTPTTTITTTTTTTTTATKNYH